MSGIILSGRGVTKRFAGLTAIENVDFDIRTGSISGLIGPNGAGKTMLFNLITGYYQPSAGDIRFNGISLKGVATFRRNQMGIARAFQIAGPFAGLTVRANIRIGAMFGRPEKRAHEKIADEAMAVADLAAVAERRAAALTAGMLHKLEIARAIATRPSMLLADEPCAGLNPVETQEMLTCLRNVRDSGVTVWLVEHDMKAVTSLCDRVLVVDAGAKIADGTPAEVVSDPRVISAYLVRRSKADQLMTGRSRPRGTCAGL